MTIKWNHIMDSQPIHGRRIIQIDAPYKDHNGKDYYTMGIREYYQNISFEEFLNWRIENDLPNPDFWWVYAEDFPFPDQK